METDRGIGREILSTRAKNSVLALIRLNLDQIGLTIIMILYQTYFFLQTFVCIAEHTLLEATISGTLPKY